METATKHRSRSTAFKRQVAEAFIADETLHALSNRHDISPQLIRIRVGKREAGALDDDVQAADLIQEHEPQVATFLQVAGNQSLKRAFLTGARHHASRPRSGSTSVVAAPRHHCQQGVRADGFAAIDLR